jgi:Na+/proline symporter
MTGALIAVLTVWIGLGVGGTALVIQGEIEISTPDALAPAFIRSLEGQGLFTVALVAIVAAVMSTAATLLNLVAAALTTDIPISLGRSAGYGVRAARVATIFAAVAAATLGLASARPVALLGVLGWGCLTAALMPTMVIGLNWSGATRRGAIAALVAGPLVQLSVEWARSHNLLGPAWEPGLTGAAAGCLALVLASLTGESNATLE